MMTTSITSSRSQFDSKRISDGARWHRRYVNGFGETVREEWPGFGDVLTQRLRDAEYDAKGRLVRGRPWGPHGRTERTKLSDKVIEMFKSEGISIKRAEYFEGEIKAFIDVSK